MRKADVVCALCLLALGLLVVAEGLRLGIGWGTDGPRSGFLPFWLGVGLGLSSLIVVWQVLAARGAATRRFVGPGKLVPVMKVLIPAVGMVVLTQVLGLYVAGGLYMGAYMRWIGRHSWPLIVLLTVGIPVVTFLIFEKWFLVSMPKGPIEAWLGY
ncbi:MAG: tripartite tricarboxylate transporter TctB family protein [Candidatus Rokubacteria bacterium]|nr:tripartite tricarboxylate transporter TctB family protein [Candidatus Rokubacteria bacterium]